MAGGSGSSPSQGKEQPFISQSHSKPSQYVPQRFNLLLAEDNLPDALLVREAIRHENLPIDLHIVSDGQQAIDFIERAEHDPEAPCPQCMLLDLNLPKVEGFEILKRIRASGKCKSIPVVVITSSDSPADRSQAAAFGARYFRKPPSYEEFLKLGRLLKQLLEEQNPG